MEAALAPPRISIPLPQPEVVSEEEEQLKRLIIQMAEENPSTVAEIIQMWLNEGNR
jgi:flagellar biosynthesis/type III secretory pathway M-ring protein FliF/YscJ